MVSIKFSHNYRKLNQPKFSTIRRMAYWAWVDRIMSPKGDWDIEKALLTIKEAKK